MHEDASGRPRPRPVHRDAVARSPARPADPRHEAEHRGVRGAIRFGASAASTTSRGNVVVVAAGNLRHDELLELVGEHGAGLSARRRARSAWNLRSRRRRPTASGRSLVKKRTTEQAHICVGTSGLSRTDPDRFAFGVVNNGAGRRDELPRCSGGPRAAGLAYSVYSYHAMYAEAGRVLRLRRHHARAREGGPRDALRAELEDVAEQGGSARTSSSARKGHMKGSLVCRSEDPGGRHVTPRASRRSGTAESSP